MIELKIRKIGNSLGVVLPKDALGMLRVEDGDALYVVEGPDGPVITPFDPNAEEDVRRGLDIMKRYRNTLKQLAK